MRLKLFLYTGAVVLLIAGLFLGTAGAAANPQYEVRMAVVLVIDASGSMVRNDPDRVRVAAAQETLDLLKDNDYLALVEFASAPRVIMRMRPVGGEAERREIRDLVAQIDQRGDTDILGGLRNAYHQLTGAPETLRKFVILLSDGESDVPGVTDTLRGRQRYFAETEALLARFAQQGWPVHCIAFCEEEAGTELASIAGRTAGEYWFISGPDELKNIFANILLAAKYPPGVQPGFHAALKERENYPVGGLLAAEAFITIGEDRVLPGPYLELAGMNLVISRPGREPVAVSFEESAEDGVFKAEVPLDAPGEYEAMVTITAKYRGQEIAESVMLGTVVAKEEVRSPLILINPGWVEAALKTAGLVAVAAGYAFLVIITIMLWRFRLRGKVRGDLRVWAESNTGHKYAKYSFRLGKVHRREVKIVAGDEQDGDFRVEAVDRQFGFVIRSIRDPFPDSKLSRLGRIIRGPRMLYEVACQPGTVLQWGDKLKTRHILYDKDVFEIGGYVFEFQCRHIGERPDGKQVLGPYRELISDADAKGKGKKVLTLRVKKQRFSN